MNKDEQWLDEDGVYPLESALEKIKNWNYNDKIGYFNFIKSLWLYADSGYWTEMPITTELTNKPAIRYLISTAGWSGNESLLEALQNNYIIFSTTWVQSRRGGHYIFEVED